MPTIRQYVNTEFAESISGVKVDEKFINAAESIIDSYCKDQMNWKSLYNHKANHCPVVVSQSDVVFTESTATVGFDNEINRFQFCVIELLTKIGTVPKGTFIPVTSSSIRTLNFDQIEGLEGSGDVKIHQVGIFPRLFDLNYSTGGTGIKTIPYPVIEAVAVQAVYLFQQAETVTEATKENGEKSKIKSESIGSSYSYTLKDTVSPKDKICEQSKTILDTLFL
jgi:hypothetical protein